MAPPPPSPSLDYWRGFFSGARASIFDTIDAAIRLAAADNPDGLRARRDAIAHRLYTVLNVLPPPEDAVVVAAAPAFPDGTRRHDPIVAEVFRVKAALASNRQMSEEELLDLLRRLQQLKFTADAIKVTEIGKAVKHLRNYGSKQIRILVRSLIEGWQAIVSEWISDEGAIVDRTPQSMEASCIEQEEGGLPSPPPPMDEAALFATRVLPYSYLSSSMKWMMTEMLGSMPRRVNNSIPQTMSQSRNSLLWPNSMIQYRTGGLISLR